MCEKLDFDLREQYFFQGIEWIFANFDLNDKFNAEIEDNSEKICSRLSDTVFHQIDFTAYSLYKYNPLTWDLIQNYDSNWKKFIL